MNATGRDQHWMGLAVAEAEKGVGRTAPNPPVGAVVVRDECLLGSGWHRAAGKPHAEREAIADAVARHGPDSTHGATIYITLEPCSTHGRTPPCTEAILAAGISRVVYACRDENPAHQGRADAILYNAGVEVVTGVGGAAAMHQLRPFFKTRRTGLPWVIWKTAMSLDARLTRPPGEGQWLTSEAARHDVQHLRSTVDAILTSGATVRRDHSSLTIRVAEFTAGRPQPWRVVFTGAPDSLPRDAPLFCDAHAARTLVRPRENLAGSLAALAGEQGVTTAMVEAGGVFSAALLAAGLVDEVVVYLAPMLCGGAVPPLGDPPPALPVRLLDPVFSRISGSSDVRLRARVARDC
jgi:diaminohydroxyphosphoribosylaminopyrimidine deaminase/5-amino-6-(5-phosphoribosylamino)uracil reductase